VYILFTELTRYSRSHTIFNAKC